MLLLFTIFHFWKQNAPKKCFLFKKIFSFSIFGIAKMRKMQYNIFKWQEML